MEENRYKEVQLTKIYSTQNINKKAQLNKRKSWNDVKIKKHLFSIFQMTRYKITAQKKETINHLVYQSIINHSTADLLKKFVQSFNFTNTNCIIDIGRKKDLIIVQISTFLMEFFSTRN